MDILVDADVIIRCEKGAFSLPEFFASRADDSFSVSAITVAELWFGVERADKRHRSRREAYLRQLLMHLPVIPYTERVAYVHARLWSELQTTGMMISAYDLIVAATALDRGAAVATFNTKHFRRVPGLTVIDPLDV